jgi:heme-degrading monooxygenase HmoA
MAVKVLIRRRIEKRHLSQFRRFLMALEGWASKHSDFFYGENLENPKNPGEYLCISTWRSIEAFKQWSHNLTSRQMEQQMTICFGMQSEGAIYIQHSS